MRFQPAAVWPAEQLALLAARWMRGFVDGAKALKRRVALRLWLHCALRFLTVSLSSCPSRDRSEQGEAVEQGLQVVLLEARPRLKRLFCDAESPDPHRSGVVDG